MTTNKETQKEWFDRVANGRSMRSVADALNISSGNMSRWLKEGKLSAEKIIAVAIELGIDPVQALLDNQVLPEQPMREKPNKAEILAKIDYLMSVLREEIDEEAEIIPLDSRRKPAQSDNMFENMVADDSPDEDELRNEDGSLD